MGSRQPRRYPSKAAPSQCIDIPGTFVHNDRESPKQHPVVYTTESRTMNVMPCIADPAAEPSSSRARPKPQLSCVICKLRKYFKCSWYSFLMLTTLCRVKCDRNQPCGTCISHGYPSSCAYPDVNVIQSTTKPHKSRRRTGNAVDAVGKLKDLERLVHLLMSERQQPPSEHHQSRQSVSQSGSALQSNKGESLTSDFGRLSIHGTEAKYVGSDHWAAVIDGVRIVPYTAIEVLQVTCSRSQSLRTILKIAASPHPNPRSQVSLPLMMKALEYSRETSDLHRETRLLMHSRPESL
jgi:hypothetical protein